MSGKLDALKSSPCALNLASAHCVRARRRFLAINATLMPKIGAPRRLSKDGSANRRRPARAPVARPSSVTARAKTLSPATSHFSPEFGPFVLLVLELAVFYAFNPEFLSVLNIGNTLTFTVELGLIALAMTLLMTAGEFDLSVGSLFGFAPVADVDALQRGWTSLDVAFFISLVVAALIGLVNGLFVTRLKIPSFLVTLGMLLVVRGTALFVTDGFPQRTWSAGGQWIANRWSATFISGRSGSMLRSSGSSRRPSFLAMS